MVAIARMMASKSTVGGAMRSTGTNYSDEDEDDRLHLTSDDLYSVPRQMTSIRLVRNFESKWNKIGNIADHDTTTNIDSNTDSLSFTKRRLVKSLWKVAAPTFIPAGVFQLVAVVVVSNMPLVASAAQQRIPGGGRCPLEL